MTQYFYKKIFLSTTLLILFFLGQVEQVVGGPVTAPEKYFGFRPGEENRLADAATLLSYFRLLDRESDRLLVQELGRTTEGRPFWMALISSPENLARRTDLIALQSALADPRAVVEARARRLVREARVVVVIACAIHPREIGSTLMSAVLAHRLVSEKSAESEAILREAMLILIPVHNPDGLDRVVKWWRDHSGTPFESGPMPFLDHPYSGHDINRDWVTLSQPETRLTVEKIYSVWRPHIVFDVHQMQGNGARMFLPPYADPYDARMDEGLQAAANALGMRMAADMTIAGHRGVAVNVYFDAFSPDRTFIPYHGGIRMLGEIASANLAAPVTLPPTDLKNEENFQPSQRSWRQPAPWGGGTWSLQNIVDYGLAAAWSILTQAAQEREYWLWTSYNALKRTAMESDEKPTFLIPPDQHDPYAVYQMIDILLRGGVEVYRARTPVVIGGTLYPQHSYLIPTAQPYGAFARTLLEATPVTLPVTQSYRPPYDVTSHHLGLALGVRVSQARGSWQGEWEKMANIRPPSSSIPVKGTQAAHGYLIDYRSNQSIKVLNGLMQKKWPVYWLTDSLHIEDDVWPPGTIWLPHDSTGYLNRQAVKHSVRFCPAPDLIGRGLWRLNQPRIGLYASHLAEADEGWTRFILEEYDFLYTRLNDADVKKGGLENTFDVVVLPSQSPERLKNGAKEGSMPLEYCGGLGQTGIDHLRSFVQKGGTLIAFGQSCGLALAHFGLPVRNVLKDISGEQFAAPGSFLRALVDARSPVGYGLPMEAALFFHQGAAFELAGGEAAVLFPGENILLDGQLRGEELLALRSAVAWVPYGGGAVLLIGARPQFRGKTASTFKLLFNGIYRSAAQGIKNTGG